MKEELPKVSPVTLKVRGEYQNPGGCSSNDQEKFLSALPRFLFAGVSNIKNFNSFMEGKTMVFTAEFELRSGKGEDWLFNLDFWPLGVRRLKFI